MGKISSEVVCPTCKEEFARDKSKAVPFCSERCRLIDLGQWLDGGYAIPGEPADIPDGSEEDSES